VQRYTVKVNGMTTTLRLSDEDAAKRGLTADPEPAPVPDPVPAKAKTPANKARRPANKARRDEIAAMAFTPKGER
jgi:hypothetical protein